MEMENEKFVTLKSAKKLWDKLFGIEYDVVSFDDRRRAKGVIYKTRHKGDDSWDCDCKSFIYETGTFTITMSDTGRIHKKTCKHIRHIMEEENLPFICGVQV